VKGHIVVAIDGPSGVGKSTVSRMLAGELGFTYIDTGAIYRAVALKASDRGIDPDDDEGVKSFCAKMCLEMSDSTIVVDGEDLTSRIRHPSTGPIASRYSAGRGVREALLRLQRDMGERGSVVMEGRDIGTVVFPAAQVKFYLDASSDVRAQRRWSELKEKGVEVEFETVKNEIEGRDRRDSTRAHAPLKKADDAVYVDTGARERDAVFRLLLEKVRERISDGDTDC